VDELPKLRQVPWEVLNAPGIYVPPDNGEGEVADARFAELAAALQAGDREGVRALFSDTALAAAEDMDVGLDYVFSLVEGGILSYERMTCGSSEVSKSYGYSHRVYSWHSVTTPQGSFIFYLLDYDSDTIDPGNVGLRTLWAIEAEDANDGFYGVTARGGIIVPFSYISGRGGADGAA
jgi:hypothetical protein